MNEQLKTALSRHVAAVEKLEDALRQVVEAAQEIRQASADGLAAASDPGLRRKLGNPQPNIPGPLLDAVNGFARFDTKRGASSALSREAERWASSVAGEAQ